LLFSFLPWGVFEKRRAKRKREKAACVVGLALVLEWCEGLVHLVWNIVVHVYFSLSCLSTRLTLSIVAWFSFQKKDEDEDEEFTAPVVLLLLARCNFNLSLAPNSLLRNLRTDMTSANFPPTLGLHLFLQEID
jgi:hypothetical protein